MTEIEPHEQAQLTAIYDLLERYQHIETEKLMALLAIRILALKHGYGPLVATLRDLGVDAVVLAAKYQLKAIVTLWEKMVSINPPPEAIQDAVLANIDTVRRAFNNVNVTARLYKQLTRMAIREDWRKFHATPKAEGESLQ